MKAQITFSVIDEFVHLYRPLKGRFVSGVAQNIKKVLKRIVYRGSRYNCPFCGFRASELEPIGLKLPLFEEHHIVGSGLRRGGCYNCRSTDRERLVYTFLKHETNFFSSLKHSILHIAPEHFLQKEILKLNFPNYICGDRFTEGYSYADFVREMDVTALPLENEQFDWVICNHVLEHVEDDRQAMREIYRVLKPGGRAVLQVPYAVDMPTTLEDKSIDTPEERTARYGQFDHVRLYGANYPDRLRSVGFSVELIYLGEKYPQMGIQTDEALFDVRKPV